MDRKPLSAKERYNKKAYDDVRLRVPRGAASFIRMAARLQARSVNSYICSAILEKMKLSKWPAGLAGLPVQDKGISRPENEKSAQIPPDDE